MQASSAALVLNTQIHVPLVVSGVWNIGLTSTVFTAEGFNTVLGGGWIVAFGSITFAYSTLLAWFYYGTTCTDYLLGIRASLLYRWTWCLLIIVGTLFSDDVAGTKFI